jgi:hypothetical protein
MLKTYLTAIPVLAIYTNIIQFLNAGGVGVMAERLRAERLQIMLSPEELTLIDDFRFAKRMPSRASTVRELFRRGLTAEGFGLAPSGTKSKEFGVNGKSPRPRR